MESSVEFLSDLTVALAAAVVAGWVARRLGLNAIVGYLVAGIAVGPFTPGYVAHDQTLGNLAELGLIFLLFSIGLEFSFRELLAAGAVPIAVSLLALVIFGAAFWGAARTMQLAHPWTLAITAVVSSTAIGVALLQQWGLAERHSGRLLLALMILQDLVSVAFLVIVSAPAASLSPVGILVPLGKAVGFVVAALVVGALVLHRLVVRVLQHAPTDALFGAFAALALVAAWLAHAAGLAFDFGAFVAGAVISEVTATRMIEAIVAPFRALFVALFFVAIGTLLDPRAVLDHWVVIVAVGGGFMLLRLGVWTGIGRLAGFPSRTALLMGAAMVPLGEFNIVLGNAATAAHRLSGSERAILLGIIFFSILATTLSGPLLEPLRRRRDALPERIVEGRVIGAPRVLIVGFGRVGRTVGDVLARCEIPFAVLERDRAVVAEVRGRGIEAVVGDGGDPRALDAAATRATRVIVATTPETTTNAAVAYRFAQRPETLVIARAAHPDDSAALRDRGAVQALVPEAEGALAFAVATLRDLGVPEDRIDQEIAAQRDAMTGPDPSSA